MKLYRSSCVILCAVFSLSVASSVLSSAGPCSDRMLRGGKMKPADYDFCLQLKEFISPSWKTIALAHAVDQLSKEIAELMIKAGADANALPILHRAVKNQDLQMTELLIAAGAKKSLLGQDKTEPAFLEKTPRQVIEDDLKKFCFSDAQGDAKNCRATKEFLAAFDRLAQSQN